MQMIRTLAIALILASLAACSSSDSDSATSPKTEAASHPSATTIAPTDEALNPEKTYVPAAGDPKTHVLNVTIRDRGLSYEPGTCVAKSGDSDSPDILAFSGPDKDFENRPFEDAQFPIPRQGTSQADGTCEAVIAVTVQYAPRYRAGIARAGNGIAGPDDAKETYIVTKGDEQEVVVVNYPT